MPAARLSQHVGHVVAAVAGEVQQRWQEDDVVMAGGRGPVEGRLDRWRVRRRILQHPAEDWLTAAGMQRMGVALEFGQAFRVLRAVAEENCGGAQFGRPRAWRTAPARRPASSSSRRRYWPPMALASCLARP